MPGPQNERYVDKGRLIRPIVKLVKTHALVLLDGGDEIVVRAGDEGVRFPLVSGTPIQAPVAWRGPIVMTTQELLHQAFTELRQGTFIRK